MKRKPRPGLCYVYDSREKLPYHLAAPDPQLFEDFGEYSDSLDAGDITCEIDCIRVPVIIERKSQGDFVGCCRHDQGCQAFRLGNDPDCGARCRFERELARLCAYAHVHILIEAPFAQLRAGYQRSSMNGLSVVNSIACWSTRFSTIHFWPVTSRIEGQVWARTLLHEAAKHEIPFLRQLEPR